MSKQSKKRKRNARRAARGARPRTGGRGAWRGWIVGLAVGAVVAFGIVSGLDSGSSTPPVSGSFQGTRAETERFIGYDLSIVLTADQEAIRRRALERMPAPCCSDFTAATCCCKCNLARSIWGLSKHLIVDEGADEAQVLAAAESWVAAVNPGGYPGNTCATGGCGRTFLHDGCGGMNPDHLVF